jgi:hypothetical protein
MNTWIVTKTPDPRGAEYGERLLVGTATAEPTYEVLRLNGCTDMETPQDNAEHLVKVLNTHADLVKALAQAVAMIEDLRAHVPDDLMKATEAEHCLLVDALAKVEGGK